MPRVANHDERRMEVCEAAWTVIARDGLESTTLRGIAHELGMTTGVLMHYFRDRDDLLSFAIDELMNRLDSRVEQLVLDKTGIPYLEAALLGGLPIDAKSQRGWKVWLAVTGASVGKPHLLEKQRVRYARQRERATATLKALQSQGLLDKRVNIVQEADTIVEMIDGIGIGWFIDPLRYTAERQTAIVQRYVESMLVRK